jgi:hypothetical protein
LMFIPATHHCTEQPRQTTRTYSPYQVSFSFSQV